MESTATILNTRISFFTGKSRPEREVKVRDVLQSIRSEMYAPRIVNLRSLLAKGDSEGYKQQKKFLPAVTFSGVFEGKRDAASCVTYTQLMVFDIDHCADKMAYVAQSLKEDAYVIAYWLSPSAEGYKGLIGLQFGDEWDLTDPNEPHKCAFRQFVQHLHERYSIQVDLSGSDIPRLCFVSHDPNICIKDEYEPFKPDRKKVEKVEVDEVLKKVPKHIFRSKPESLAQQMKWSSFCGSAKHYSKHQQYRMKVTNIYKHLKKKGVSITDNYRNWVVVAYTIASHVHPYMGKELFLNMCRLDGTAHNEKNSIRLIEHAYRTLNHRLNFGYIVNLARQKGIWSKF